MKEFKKIKFGDFLFSLWGVLLGWFLTGFIQYFSHYELQKSGNILTTLLITPVVFFGSFFSWQQFLLEDWLLILQLIFTIWVAIVFLIVLLRKKLERKTKILLCIINIFLSLPILTAIGFICLSLTLHPPS